MRIIAGTAKGTHLLSKNNYDTRPMLERAREALFNILGDQVHHALVLDLFAGTGSLGLEALSRGAKFCHFVEMSRESQEIITANIEKCHVQERAKLWKQNAFQVMKFLVPNQFNLIFLDPPYHYFDQPVSRREFLEFVSQLAKQIAAVEASLVLHYRRFALAGMPIPPPLVQYDLRNYGTTELMFLSKK